MRDRVEAFFTKSNNIKRDGYTWNTLSATMFALQSAIVLIVINRTNGIEDAGIFSIAYAVGSLMYYIGEYGVRKYQVSDISEQMSFTDYHSHRIVACAITLLVIAVYIANGYYRLGYSSYKSLSILLICLIKVVEAYSEVFFGRFQQVGRLDVAAKTNLFRTVIGVIAFIISLLITHDMLISLSMWLLFIIIAFMTSSLVIYKSFGSIECSFNWEKIARIFIDCLPLFSGYFLLLYVGNAPKYAIDSCLGDADQARYNFIFMPVFAIGLLANFVFNPILVRLAHSWDEGDRITFKKSVVRQIFVIAAITMLAIFTALTIGTPVLGALYNTSLSEYKIELAILMIGGGMLALVNFFAVIVTVMRYQNRLIVGYVIMSALAWIMSKSIVQQYGIRGACILYTLLMALQALIFAGITFYYISKVRNTGQN